MSVLELDDVDVTYERRDHVKLKAVVGASLSVDRGQIVGLVGESGCGKSSLARAAVGLVAPSAGRVRFEGQEVSALTRRARPRALTRLQLVFQNPYSSLNPRRKVGDQIADGLPDGTGGRAGRARVGELLERVGLSPGAAERFPSQFSGGSLVVQISIAWGQRGWYGHPSGIC
jgi:peptide/nickel transport system ATP-binding protein